MQKFLFNFLILFSLILTLTSCEAIGSIFKAGLWVGVIGVALVVALVLFILNKMR